jgi:hypothetical protein
MSELAGFAGFTGFAADHSEPLTRTAYLLTGAVR